MKFNQEVEAGGVLTAGREPGATGVATEDLCLAKRVKELEVQAMQVHIRAPEGLLPCPRVHPATHTSASAGSHLTKHIKLLPQFHETEVDPCLRLLSI